MSAFYQGMQQVALSLIADKGQSLPIRRITKTYDPVTGATSAATKVSASLNSVVVRVGPSDNKLIEALGLIRTKVRKVICSAVDAEFEPAEMDVIDLEGAYYMVKYLTPINPAGLPLVYILLLEKGSLSAVDLAATEAP